MKLVHKQLNPPDSATIHEWLEYAKLMEQQHADMDAIAAYAQVVKKSPLNENAYNRQMILLRKSKEFEKEMKVLDKGIEAFKRFYGNANKLNHSGKIKKLSRSISTITGLVDKKGITSYEPEPIGRWNRRKAAIEKLLSKTTAQKK